MNLLKIFRFPDFIQYFPDFLQRFPDFSQTKFFKVRKCERCGSLNPSLEIRVSNFKKPLKLTTVYNRWSSYYGFVYNQQKTLLLWLSLPYTAESDSTNKLQESNTHKIDNNNNDK